MLAGVLRVRPCVSRGADVTPLFRRTRPTHATGGCPARPLKLIGKPDMKPLVCHILHTHTPWCFSVFVSSPNRGGTTRRSSYGPLLFLFKGALLLKNGLQKCAFFALEKFLHFSESNE